MVLLFGAAIASVAAAQAQERAAIDVLGDIYRTCLSAQSVSGCAKPKALAWLSSVADEDVIRITGDLTVVRTQTVAETSERNFATKEERIADYVLNFLESHALKMEVPEILRTEQARSLNGNEEIGNSIEIPLVAGQVQEGEWSAR